MKSEKLNLTQIGLYNPQRMSDEVVEKIFIVRKNRFSHLIEKIKSETANSIPQHHLIIAQRGMGKSTLLKRIEVELRKENLAKNYIPLLFPEEQYNISNLAGLWLNCLDALADTLEIENNNSLVEEIDQHVEQLDKEGDEVERANQAYAFLQLLTKQLKRRVVLLIDNINIVLGRLDQNEQHRLRNVLTQNAAPIIIGASSVAMDETENYGAPFYDAFDSHFLKKLTFKELLSIITSLAELTDAKNLQPEIYNEIGRLKTLHQLTGGNPRTAVMLFKLIVNGFSTAVNDDLEALLDEITPLYKARFEELPEQAQRIVDAVALNWEPIHIAQLRQITGLENNQLSPQLKRLYEVGWLDKQDAYKTKGAAYQISERFFNIWFLMRRSSRRQKKTIIYLSRFLEMWYGAKLDELGKNRLGKTYTNSSQIIYDLAIANVLKDKDIAERLKEQSLSAVSNQFGKDRSLQWLVEEESLTYYKISTSVWDLIDSKKYVEAKKLLLNTIKVNPNNDFNYSVLGWFYQDYLQDYQKSEASYLKAIAINPNSELAYNGLGNLYQYYIQDYQKSETSYLKAIAINPNSELAYNGLGNLYQLYLKDYQKSESSYLKAIELNPNDEVAYYNLGILYQSLQDYQKSETSYLKAIELNPNSEFAKYNLIYLYRDYLNKIFEAKKTFAKLAPSKELEDVYYLTEAIFFVYEQNLGLAADSLAKAFACLDSQLKSNTQDEWWKAASIIYKLGHTQWFLELQKKLGIHKTLAPYYIANEALLQEDKPAFIKSKAEELRKPSWKILEKIELFLKN